MYDTDIAYIHDVGFSSYALNAAPGILAWLDRYDAGQGTVLDLGCGSGLLTRELAMAGYQVMGTDISEPILEIARRRVPGVEFRQASLLDAPLPRASAIVCIGEVLSYAAAPLRSTSAVARFFRRAYKALPPGGMFLIDFAQPGRYPAGMPRHSHWSGEDWVILLDVEPQPNPNLLVRKLTAFRQIGKHWRRSDETHRLRLFPDPEIRTLLEQAGFPDPHFVRALGHYRFSSGHSAVLAVKPQY
jgi:SAM-dependent methyltransferase